MSFTPTPWYRRCSSITSPRSFLHPMRYILPLLSVFPTSHCVVCTFTREHSRCTGYLILLFRSCSCRLSILSLLPCSKLCLCVLVLFLAFLLPSACGTRVAPRFLPHYSARLMRHRCFDPSPFMSARHHVNILFWCWYFYLCYEFACG